jgi:hypothetical protein
MILGTSFSFQTMLASIGGIVANGVQPRLKGGLKFSRNPPQ